MALSAEPQCAFLHTEFLKRKEKVRGYRRRWVQLHLGAYPSREKSPFPTTHIPLVQAVTKVGGKGGTLSVWPSKLRKDGHLERVKGVPSVWCPPGRPGAGQPPSPGLWLALVEDGDALNSGLHARSLSELAWESVRASGGPVLERRDLGLRDSAMCPSHHKEVASPGVTGVCLIPEPSDGHEPKPAASRT